jgi:hypothetical protein
MSIPQYATCSMCKEFSESNCDWTKGTCAVAEDAAKEGMITAGVTAMRVHVTIAWNAKPCEQWEATPQGQRELDLHEAEVASIAKSEGGVAA